MTGLAESSLAAQGERKIDWAAGWTPVLGKVCRRLAREDGVRGRRVALVLPIQPTTAVLAVGLAEAGGEVTATFPGAIVHEDVAAALVERGVDVFSTPASAADDELRFVADLLARGPEVVVEDRPLVAARADTTARGLAGTLLGASEGTTSVAPLRVPGAEGGLRIPCLAVDDARCTRLFDRYGSGQAALAAVLDATNVLLAGRRLAVVGYGSVGKGVARRARGMAARVTVSEVDPHAALEAHHDGFDVAPVEEACSVADVVVTATGVRRALPLSAVERLGDGALLANAGARDDEIDVEGLRERAIETLVARPNVEEFRLDGERSVFVVAGGVSVARPAAEGRPIELADLTLSLHALAARHLLVHGAAMPAGVHAVPPEIDEAVARDSLEALGLRISEHAP
ncbi:MAG: adenosylhomocysteinase [Thermoleophilia bacterium]|nr:adenosylhomocysteinase [Thermoleophilia bacterium]